MRSYQRKVSKKCLLSLTTNLLNPFFPLSSSTDSTLKLWNRESAECIRTFSGHSNEKNFVGLSANGDWISCGSETNTLYTYHKSSTIPVSTFKFPFTHERGGLPVSSDIIICFLKKLMLTCCFTRT